MPGQFVINGAQLKCPLCSSSGKLVVSHAKVHMQDQCWATEADNKKKNLVFDGVCKRDRRRRPACKSVISPTKWTSIVDSVSVDGKLALLESSSIKCTRGNVDISIVQTAQMDVPTDLPESIPVGVRVVPKRNTFVPLGIPNYKGEEENKYILFEIRILGSNASRALIEIVKEDDDQVIYDGEITEEKNLTVGSHTIGWDGFDNDEVLDTHLLKTGNLYIRVTVWQYGREVQDRVSLRNISPDKVDWVDIKIQKEIKRIDLILRVNFRDGGSQGLRNGGNVPEEKLGSGLPLNSRTIPFEALKQLALQGISYHWGRNSLHPTGKGVTIDGDIYEVYVQAINSEDNHIETPKIIFVTNKSPGRSRNWGLSRILFYNVGYLEFTNGWFFYDTFSANENFKTTSAHEIGHPILASFHGTEHSFSHKGSTTVLTQSVLSSQGFYPTSGEIDLMQYYQNKPSYPDNLREVAAEKDVLGLLWLNKMSY